MRKSSAPFFLTVVADPILNKGEPPAFNPIRNKVLQKVTLMSLAYEAVFNRKPNFTASFTYYSIVMPLQYPNISTFFNKHKSSYYNKEKARP